MLILLLVFVTFIILENYNLRQIKYKQNMYTETLKIVEVRSRNKQIKKYIIPMKFNISTNEPNHRVTLGLFSAIRNCIRRSCFSFKCKQGKEHGITIEQLARKTEVYEKVKMTFCFFNLEINNWTLIFENQRGTIAPVISSWFVSKDKVA